MVKIKNKKGHVKTAIFEIAVLVIATIAFSYFVHTSDKLEGGNVLIENSPASSLTGLGLVILKIISKILFSEKTLVSALEELHTCVNGKDGKTCKVYPASICNSNCADACIPQTPDKVEQCKAGTCYNGNSGICMINTLKTSCTASGSTWFDDPNGNVIQCKRGCCLNSGNAWWATDRECTRDAEIKGIEKEFKLEIRSELACLAEGNAQVSGACVTVKDAITQKNLCLFTTAKDCSQKKGAFHAGFLCSAEELGTVCEKQKTTNCVDGLDDVYWFDSCGNRENIYDANKVKSWNGGKVLTGAEGICSVGRNLENQGTCGNCERTVNSACGQATGSEKLSDATQKVVCRDLSCKDEKGKTRENGESWCFYQGAIGVSNDGLRSMDTPGSEHYVKTCMDGEVRTERCGNYRDSICVESKTARDDGSSYTSASCQVNGWMECLAANLEDTNAKKIEKCTEAQFCFVKKVKVGDDFEFDTCAPKYPGGHDLNTEVNPYCSQLGSTTCKTVKVKTESFTTECKAGCKCDDDDGKFLKNMNDLCTSLGDCGGEVNYMGTYSQGYTTLHAPVPAQSYFDELKTYDEPIDGKVAEPFDSWNYSGTLGTSTIEGDEDFEDYVDNQEARMNRMGNLGMLALPKIGGFAYASESGALLTNLNLRFFGNIVIGAIVASAAAAWAIKIAGIGPGLSMDTANILVGAAAVAGAMSYAYSGGAAWGASAATSSTIVTVGIVILIVIAVIIFVMWISGVGDVSKKKHIYTCESWAPVSGGEECNKCGSDGVPCSPYACSSLGTKCQLVNGDTDKPECINQGPDDIAPPVINPLIGNISEGYAYTDIAENGFKIKSSSGDGCVDESSIIQFGLQLDKYGRCRFDTEAGKNYDGMVYPFGLTLMKAQQVSIVPIPSMEDLGSVSYNPSARATFNMYIRCENINGKKRTADYAVQFCVKPGEDKTAPLITIRPSRVYAASDAKNKSVKIFTDEPAECRWSESDKDYSAMSGNFICKNEIEQMTIDGWECKAEIPLKKDETTIYTRCLDRPSVENITDRNANAQSIPMTIVKTSPLLIDSASPDKEIIASSINPTTVNILVQTSGGLNSGISTCIYAYDGMKFTPEFELSTSSHEIKPIFFGGKHSVEILCGDEAGNSVRKSISFELQIDTRAPEVTRVYANAGTLTIKTNEPAECALSTEKCSFAFENGTLMYGTEFEHTSSVERNKVYYIMCKDPSGNMKGECDKTVRVISGISQGL